MTTAPTRPRTRTDDPVDERRAAPPTSRHPGDAVRVGLGVAVLLVSLLAIQRDRLTTFEVNLFRLVNELPDALAWVLGPVMQMGNVFAAPATALVALVVLRGRRRVAFDIVASGVLAWVAAKAVKSLVERPRPGGLVEDVNRIAGTEGLGFVSGHTAVAAAIVAAASPYLPRRVRRAVWVVPWTVGIARIYYGAHLPLDIVGGAALGWALAAGLHLLLGAPHRIPTLAEAEGVLRAAGVPVTAVDRLGPTARGSFPFVGHVRGSNRFVKLLDPEPRDRDWVYRGARFLAFRDVRDEAEVADAATQAHREGAMALLARVHGARVPSIRAIESDRGRVWIVEDHVRGTTLDRLGPESVTDDVLDDLWRQVGLLRAAGIAHRDLVATNVLVDEASEVWLVDFAHAESSTRGRALDNDVAELLATTALLVGTRRAVDAAHRVLGPDAVAAAIPELQPFVLTAENRARLRATDGLLDALRAAAVDAVGAPAAEPAEPAEVPRGQPAAVLALAAGVMAALLAVAGPADAVEVLETPGYRWIGLAVVCVAVLPLAGASSLLASVARRLALGRTAGEVVRFRHHNTLRGRASGYRSLIGELGRAGVPPIEARTAIHRWLWIHVAVSVLAATGLVAVAIVDGASASWPDDAVPVALVLAAAALVEVLLGRRGGIADDRSVRAWDRRVRAEVGMAVVAGVVEVGLATIATVAVVLALGGGALVASIGVVALAVGLADRLGPLAGAPGTAPALLVLGLVSVGVSTPVAATAAVASQLLVLWLPVAAGAVRAGVGARW